ncbi:gamma-glutamyl-gamma-aminobutyrate hydrolase family protein [Bowmanella yangjiangensis]|uniref:Gamma-glutamyl-gamma-aminobutyrate hydrolase family protein n=1 Tax=Bowmanella yangjiangensis TaxID=2811230 RepID=A0ABS3CSP2_9ALTE|nr:gamma-glutamyl-gamma-aminobutyrate hydrolase family protein [Bowmanella yangjiangensis]
MRNASPLFIGVCADLIVRGPHAYHQSGDKYIRALMHGDTPVVPLVIPALFHTLSKACQSAFIEKLDGVLLTGSYSNLHPSYYEEAEQEGDDAERDPHRDASNWALFDSVLAADLPMLGICRGFQELNVYFGGSLHHRLHEVKGLMDHREDKEQPVEQQYAPAHPVQLSGQGILSEWFASQQSIQVNSIHMQGVKELGHGLQVEARAEDGLIEAFSRPHSSFLLALQWHPEWRPEQYPQNAQILTGFIEACQTWRDKRSQR